MELPKLTDMVAKEKKVYFSFYRDGELWYKAENGFEFPIPKEDMKGAIFKPEDKSIFFMRFLKKHLEYLKKSMNDENVLVFHCDCGCTEYEHNHCDCNCGCGK